jgi:fructokinase
LKARLGRDVRIENDANCFAVSEATDGAAAGAAVVFGVIVGTGVGGGIVVRGQPIAGPNAIAGEWGHNPLPWPTGDEREGPECYCGRRGCIETFLSGPGLIADHQHHTGRREPTQAIVEGAATGDVGAEGTLRRYEERMARALASVINVLDPDIIVLGGGMSNIDRLYENVPRLWAPYVFTARQETVRTRLARARYGDSSGVRGAAWLWPISRT